jgi:hypothetical protein
MPAARRFRPISLPHFLPAFALLFVVACGGKPSTGGATATPTPKERLTTAAARLQSVSAFHFVLSHQNGASTIANGLLMTRAEGDFARPDRFNAAVNASFEGFPVMVKLINVGDKTWITNPLQGGDHYQPLTNGPQTTAILDPNSGLLAVASKMNNPKLTGSEKIGNVDAYLVQGTVDAVTLQSVATDAEAGRQVPARVWIGKADSLVYRIRIEGPLSASEPKGIVRQVDLSQFDEKVDIEPPSSS